jgi:uncharacterized membrane protein YqjE
MSERPLGELFSELAQQTGTLIKKEVELAKVELNEKASFTTRQVMFMAIGGGICAAGGLVLLGAIVLLLAKLVPLWASALMVGAVVTIVGAAILLKGRTGLKRVDLVPRETIRSLKETKTWAKVELAK